MWPIPVSDWLGIYHLQVRLLRWFSSAWKGDFCGLYLEIFLSIISRRCFAYFAVDRLFTRLSSVCKGILFSLFSSVPFELELLKESSQFQFIYGILKRHTSVSVAKHGAFISLMLCRSDTIKKMSFGLTSYLSHILNSDSQIKARLYEKKNILRQETGHLMPFIDNKR